MDKQPGKDYGRTVTLCNTSDKISITCQAVNAHRKHDTILLCQLPLGFPAGRQCFVWLLQITESSVAEREGVARSFVPGKKPPF
jgi:hypothetical protein